RCAQHLLVAAVRQQSRKTSNGGLDASPCESVFPDWSRRRGIFHRVSALSSDGRKLRRRASGELPTGLAERLGSHRRTRGIAGFLCRTSLPTAWPMARSFGPHCRSGRRNIGGAQPGGCWFFRSGSDASLLRGGGSVVESAHVPCPLCQNREDPTTDLLVVFELTRILLDRFTATPGYPRFSQCRGRPNGNSHFAFQFKLGSQG